MAARGVSKVSGAGKAAGGGTAEDKLAAALAERDRLKAELAEAKALIAQLRARQAEVVNRIAWVIDSIHNILEDQE